MQAEGLNALRFAEKLEVQPSSISHILSGRNKPSFDFIEKLLSKYPKLNPDWLLLGNGDMYRSLFPQSEPLLPELFPDGPEDIPNEKKSHEKERITNEKEIDNKTDIDNTVQKNKEIDRIVILYNDGTFRDYYK